MSLTITSVQNLWVKEVARLRDRAGRDSARRTLVEGYRLLSRALENGFPLDVCFHCPAMFLGTNEPALLKGLKAAGVKLIEVSEQVMSKLAYRDRPEGLVAVAPIPKHPLSALPDRADGLYVVVESIEKPGNLGAMLRSADACGVAGVLVCDRRTDIYNPNVLTSSTGAVFTVPLAECSSEEALAWIRSSGAISVAATPHAEKAYYELDLTGKMALVVGSEQLGLSDFWLNSADCSRVIPMLGMADSLNVSIAASVVLFEAARQRANALASYSKISSP